MTFKAAYRRRRDTVSGVLGGVTAWEFGQRSTNGRGRNSLVDAAVVSAAVVGVAVVGVAIVGAAIVHDVMVTGSALRIAALPDPVASSTGQPPGCADPISSLRRPWTRSGVDVIPAVFLEYEGLLIAKLALGLLLRWLESHSRSPLKAAILAVRIGPFVSFVEPIFTSRRTDPPNRAAHLAGHGGGVHSATA